MTTVKMKMTAFSASQMGVFSTLICGETELFVLEPPWDTNDRFNQCIPAGVYDVARIPNDNDEDEWLVLDVPERCAILFATGETRDNTNGNLLIGDILGTKGDQWAIGNAADAWETFNKCLEGVNEFRLYIDRSIIHQSLNNNIR